MLTSSIDSRLEEVMNEHDLHSQEGGKKSEAELYAKSLRT